MKKEITKFSVTLLDAQGDRTLAEFAVDCQISINTLNRLYNGDTPSINTLKKIAENAENDIMFEDLVTSAYELYLPHHSTKNYYFPRTFFSKNLWFLRTEKSLSWEELALTLNECSCSLVQIRKKLASTYEQISKLDHRFYTWRTICSFETGIEQPTLSDLELISFYFDVPFSDIATADIQSNLRENK